MRRRLAAAWLILALPTGCAGGGMATNRSSDSAAPASSPAPYVLKVALYPWIPDAADDDFVSLRERLQAEFERRHADIRVDIRLIEYDDSYYSPALVSAWLASGAYDLVEIDTVILGDLIEAGAIEPWSGQDASRFFPAAVQGATGVGANGGRAWWGIPHFLCGFFIVTESPRIAASNTIEELVAAVQDDGRPLLGNFDSSWDLPSLYLDATVDNGRPAAELEERLRPPLHAPSANALAAFADLCRLGTSNPCVDGTYAGAEADNPVLEFVRGEAAGFWGYSERLHLAVRTLNAAGRATDQLRISTIPLGTAANPVLFSDAFVKRDGCASEPRCQAAAEAFADFMNSDWAVSEILLSGDAVEWGTAVVPRYLLPAAKSAYAIDGIASDGLYAQLRPFAETGSALPNGAGPGDPSMYQWRWVLTWLLEQEMVP